MVSLNCLSLVTLAAGGGAYKSLGGLLFQRAGIMREMIHILMDRLMDGSMDNSV